MHRKGPAARPARHSKAQFVQDAHCQLATVPEFNDVVSTDLDEAAAADALTSTGLFGCLPASTFPLTITSRALTSAFTCPFGPTVRQLFVVRLSFPSTMPSTKRSSLPVTSPLILIPWLMHAAARDEVGTAPDTEGMLEVVGLEEVAEIAGAAGLPETPSGFESSFFHICHLDIENWIFEAAYRRAGWNCDSEE